MNNADFEYLAFGPAGPATSLVILLHGYGRNALYMEKMAEAVREHVPGAMVLCLHAPEPLAHAGVPANGQYLPLPVDVQAGSGGLDPGMLRQWFNIDGNINALIPLLENVGRRLNNFIDRQRDDLGLTDRNVVLMGFSQGGGTALYTAFMRATALAALVCHSTIILDTKNADAHFRSRPPTLLLYGTKDPEFPQRLYKRSFEWLNNYSGGMAVRKTVAGLGHSTNAKSRKICAEFIRDALAPDRFP